MNIWFLWLKRSILMHLIQCKQNLSPFWRTNSKKTKNKHLKIAFFEETTILGSFLKILINFFFQNKKNKKELVFFCGDFN